MPGPPPYGRSSTLRYASLAKSRGLRQCQRPQPALQRPARHAVLCGRLHHFREQRNDFDSHRYTRIAAAATPQLTQTQHQKSNCQSTCTRRASGSIASRYAGTSGISRSRPSSPATRITACAAVSSIPVTATEQLAVAIDDRKTDQVRPGRSRPCAACGSFARGTPTSAPRHAADDSRSFSPSSSTSTCPHECARTPPKIPSTSPRPSRAPPATIDRNRAGCRATP